MGPSPACYQRAWAPTSLGLTLAEAKGTLEGVQRILADRRLVPNPITRRALVHRSLSRCQRDTHQEDLGTIPNAVEKQRGKCQDDRCKLRRQDRRPHFVAPTKRDQVRRFAGSEARDRLRDQVPRSPSTASTASLRAWCLHIFPTPHAIAGHQEHHPTANVIR